MWGTLKRDISLSTRKTPSPSFRFDEDARHWITPDWDQRITEKISMEDQASTRAKSGTNGVSSQNGGGHRKGTAKKGRITGPF